MSEGELRNLSDSLKILVYISLSKWTCNVTGKLNIAFRETVNNALQSYIAKYQISTNHSQERFVTHMLTNFLTKSLY